MNSYPIPGFSEPFSSLTHLLGAGFFAGLGFFLVRRGHGSVARMFSLGVFVFACVFLLSMSGVYHLLEAGGTGHRVLQRLDHAGIFAIIAGSFTPIHWMLFRGWGRWGVLALIWTLAITGIVLKAIFFDSIPEWLGLGLFLGMGWIGLGTGVALCRRHGFALIRPLVYSGLSYSLGAVLEFLRWPTPIPGIVGPHELFHLALLVGIGVLGSMERKPGQGRSVLRPAKRTLDADGATPRYRQPGLAAASPGCLTASAEESRGGSAPSGGKWDSVPLAPSALAVRGERSVAAYRFDLGGLRMDWAVIHTGAGARARGLEKD